MDSLAKGRCVFSVPVFTIIFTRAREYGTD